VCRILAWSQDRRRLAVGTSDEMVAIWDRHLREPKPAERGHRQLRTNLVDSALHDWLH